MVAGAGVVAMAAGVAMTMGSGAASAAPASTTWKDGSTTITRTVDDVNANAYDMVKVSVRLARSSAASADVVARDGHDIDRAP